MKICLKIFRTSRPKTLSLILLATIMIFKIQMEIPKSIFRLMPRLLLLSKLWSHRDFIANSFSILKFVASEG